MNSYILAPAAQRDLRALQAYIAQENIQAARRVLAEIRAACARLADNPHLGHVREDLTDQPVCFWAVRTYYIIYRPETRPLEIVRCAQRTRYPAPLVALTPVLLALGTRLRGQSEISLRSRFPLILDSARCAHSSRRFLDPCTAARKSTL